jgi:hypothetical protein
LEELRPYYIRFALDVRGFEYELCIVSRVEGMVFLKRFGRDKPKQKLLI